MMRFGVAAECITKALALVLVCCVASCVQEKPAPAPVAPDAQGAPVETSAAPAAPAAADWSQARVYVAAGNAQLGKAAEMLQQEVAKRSGVELAVSDGPASGEGPAIVLGTAAALPASFSLPAGVTVPDKADGYAAHLDGGTLYLVGHDERGALYAVGQFIRSANLAKGRIALPESLSISTAPVYAMRGHQLGYRKTANSYDAWTVETYEQYVRDCIIFGANAVEVIPSFNEEEDQSPVMPVPQEQMNRKISGMLAPYGIDGGCSSNWRRTCGTRKSTGRRWKRGTRCSRSIRRSIVDGAGRRPGRHGTAGPDAVAGGDGPGVAETLPGGGSLGVKPGLHR